MRKAHEDTAHGNIKDTLAELRSKYWLINSRKMVTDFIAKCRRCKRQSFPFSNTGVDYAGPYLIKQIYDNDSSHDMFNVHIVLYTCAATRAVHLDLVPDTGASAFLRSLKRFIGRRGIPNLMISDNATCFKNEEVKLSEELVTLGIKWKFIIEASPWWGGFWERLIRSMKRSLNRVVFRASLNYEELLTVVIQIEGIMNSRPLTYINADVEEILTPGHLIMGKRLLDQNEDDFEDIISDKLNLTKRAKYMKAINDHYWSRWQKEYLLELRNTHIQNGDASTIISVGEVVIIHENAKRHWWRLGVIVKLIKGSDGNVRAVTLKTSKNGKVIFLNRPIEKLYPLEIRSQEVVTDSDIERTQGISHNYEFNENEAEVCDRPRREAGENGVIIRRLLGQT